MGRYDAIKEQPFKFDKSKLWFKDVQYIENVLYKLENKLRHERESPRSEAFGERL